MQRLLKNILKPASIIIACLVLYSCANIVAPTGGPRDEDPPEVLSSNPPNFSPNFNGNQIRVFFNEFIQLKDINQKLLVSPPFEKQPEARLRGKSIIIKFDETLRENTTYNFFFGDAIVDNNEGNAIPNFQFVFSTGPYVDSLSIDGMVTDAFTLKPVQGVYVMLYENLSDSVPYLERPVYLAKTNKDGYFGIGNIRQGNYKIFALEDLNANFRFDLPDERIAFIDSIVVPRFVTPQAPAADPENDHGVAPLPNARTIPSGTPAAIPERPTRPGRPLINQPAASPGITDTARVAEKPKQGMFHLKLFQEADTIQRLVSASILKPGLVQMLFRVPFDTVLVRDLSLQLPEKWFLPEPAPTRDTLLLWLLPPFADSLNLEVADRGAVLDTINLTTRPREVRQRGSAREATPALNLRLNTGRGSPLPYYMPLIITAENPTNRIDTTLIKIMTADSVFVAPDFEFSDPLKRHLRLKTDLAQQKNYLLEILPGAFTDIFGNKNDTLRTNFSTNRFEDYGTIILVLSVQQGPGQFLLQLTDKDGKTLRENIINGSGTYEFKNLVPGHFGLRLIHDLNKNGLWDTGHYLRKIQPEPVYLFDGMLQVRQNWESEMSWDVNL